MENESYDPASETGKTILNATNAQAAREALGLGTLATQDAANVNITGGTVAVDQAATVLTNEDHMLTANEENVLVVATTQNVTLTLPEAPNNGKPYTVKAKTAGGYTVTVAKHVNSTATIDGANSIQVGNGSARTLVYYQDADGWAIQ